MLPLSVLDLADVAVIASVPAVGDGTLRDLLVDRHPVFWIPDTRWFCVILVGTPRRFKSRSMRAGPSCPLNFAGFS